MAKAGRAGHLIATKPGKKDVKKLLLIAHLDTVFEADSPFQTFVRNGDEAVGPGAGDESLAHAALGSDDGDAKGHAVICQRT